MTIEELGPADMQIVMMAIERVCITLKLTDREEHLRRKTRVGALIIQCAEDSERSARR
jgi:hypothetical protein